MATYTDNFNLKKPTSNDAVDIGDINGNMDMLDAVLHDHLSDTDNPHRATKEQIGLGNVPNVTTNDQTPTYTEASLLSNLESGEKISIAFGKIKKAVAALISHLSNKANPHGVDAEQTNAYGMLLPLADLPDLDLNNCLTPGSYKLPDGYYVNDIQNGPEPMLGNIRLDVIEIADWSLGKMYLQKFTSLGGEFSRHGMRSEYGTNFYDWFLSGSSILAKSDFILEAHTDTTTTEDGARANWNYRKWYSGFLEMWGEVDYFDGGSYAGITTEPVKRTLVIGGVSYDIIIGYTTKQTMSQINFPIAFNASPEIVANWNIGGSDVLVTMASVRADGFTPRLFSVTSSAISGYLRIHACGFWK